MPEFSDSLENSVDKALTDVRLLGDRSRWPTVKRCERYGAANA